MDSIVFWSIAFSLLLVAISSIVAWVKVRKLSDRLHQQERKFSLAMETLSEAYWVYDLASDDLFLSPAYTRLLGFDPRRLDHHYGIFDSLVHPEDRESILIDIQTSIEQRQPEFERKLRIHAKHQGYLYVLFSMRIAQTDLSGNASKLAGTLTNITHLKNAEKELRRRNLVDQQAIQSRSKFLATISHEIRTPMNAISGLSYLLLQSQLSKTQQNDINNIQRSSQTLINTVNDVFELSQLESGQAKIESNEFHLFEIFEVIFNSLDFKAREKNIDLIFDIDESQPLGLLGDPTRIGQVLTHLTNKLIESSGQSNFKIATKTCTAGDKKFQLYFCISTTKLNGEEQRDERKSLELPVDVNNRFSRRGLNLAIAKELLRLMGGKLDIGLNAEPHAYCSGQIPIENARNPSILKQFQYPQERTALKVLVVEPHADLAKSVCRLLKSFSINYFVCQTPNKTVQTMLSELINPHTLVILGTGLTQIQADQIHKQIQSLPVPSINPAVIRLCQNDDPLKSEISSNVAYLDKPITPARLYKTIIELVAKHQTQKAEQLDDHLPGSTELHNILLVEDNRVNQHVASELLEQLGSAVTVANHGREAVELLTDTQYDLVLMDIQMPEMDGLAATKNIRQNPKLRKMPIIAMTAHATQSDRDIALASGMDDFITKPIDSYTLYKTLRRWIKRPVVKPRNPGTPKPSKASRLSKIRQHIDTKTGLAHVNNNQALYFKLLQEFYRDHRKDGDAIQQSIKQNDFDTIRRITHTIVGISANIGAKNLYHSSKTLNTAVLSNSLPNPDTLQDFYYHFSAVMDALRNTDQSNKIKKIISSTVKPDRSKITEVLSHLDQLLRHGDSEAVELMEKIKIHLDYFDIDDQVKELGQRINYFRFEDARQSLGKVATSLNINLIK